jgi:ribosomal protein L30E
MKARPIIKRGECKYYKLNNIAILCQKKSKIYFGHINGRQFDYCSYSIQSYINGNNIVEPISGNEAKLFAPHLFIN